MSNIQPVLDLRGENGDLKVELDTLQAEIARLTKDVEHYRFQADEAGTTRVRYRQTIAQQGGEIAQLNLWIYAEKDSMNGPEHAPLHRDEFTGGSLFWLSRNDYPEDVK